MKFQDLPIAPRIMWAKSGEPQGTSLLCHMLDVAAVAEAIVTRESPRTLTWAGQQFGLEDLRVGRALAAVIGLHDLGKSIQGFQEKWPHGRDQLISAGLPFLPRLSGKNRHDLATPELFKRALSGTPFVTTGCWQVAMALGAHHGFFASLRQCKDALPSAEPTDWIEARRVLFKAYWNTLDPPALGISEISAPATAWLAGLTSVSDWIGSNTDWFPWGERAETLEEHLAAARRLAEHALDEIGWPKWGKLLDTDASSVDLVNRMLGREGLEARPLQVAADRLLASAEGPTLLLVEAPMGEGKTELAFLAHLRLQASNMHRGLYVALPTQATGNALFGRALTFLKAFKMDSAIDIQLVHGGAAHNEQVSRLRGVEGSGVPGQESLDDSVASSAWFSVRKRPLLSPYGVGTIDQALLATLNVKHHFVRLWGLANRVVVLDEVHAYDTYTGGLIEALLRWLKALNCSVVLMSATLPAGKRQALLSAWGVREAPVLPYPRVFMATGPGGERVAGSHFPGRASAPIRIEGIPEDLGSMTHSAQAALESDGCGAILLNTVQRAQEAYSILKAKLGPEVKLLLFHARFPADERAIREKEVLGIFGQDTGTLRPQKALLVATQVAEQSLDIDFDFMLSDLAPIDLLLQRAGRLHRHTRTRPPAHACPVFHIAGLQKDRLPDLTGTAWGFVYDPYILYRTWGFTSVEPFWNLPEDIDRLVQSVYGPDPFPGEDDHSKVIDEAFGKHLAKQQDAENLAYASALSANAEAMDAFIKVPLGEEDDVATRLLAATRLGDPGCTVVPVHVALDGWRVSPSSPPFNPEEPIEDCLAHHLFDRQLRLGRRGLVRALIKSSLPKGFQDHPLLRNLHPLCLEEGRAIVEGHRIRLDPELGIIYLPKEDA